MQRIIQTPKGERIIEPSGIKLPEEGGILVEPHFISDVDGLKKMGDAFLIGPDEFTEAFSAYILDKIEERYV